MRGRDGCVHSDGRPREVVRHGDFPDRWLKVHQAMNANGTFNASSTDRLEIHVRPSLCFQRATRGSACTTSWLVSGAHEAEEFARHTTSHGLGAVGET